MRDNHFEHCGRDCGVEMSQSCRGKMGLKASAAGSCFEMDG
jgi:hypothetical protein